MIIINYLYLIIGESGTGKTSVCDILEKNYGLSSVQSYTTRPRRHKQEIGHIFVTPEIFFNLEDKVAVKKFDGNYYCATLNQVEESDLYVIDPSTVPEFKATYHLMNGTKKIKTIYITSSLTNRYERMCKRLTDKGTSRLEASEQALKRIVNDATEFTKARQVADTIFTNNDEYRDVEHLAEAVWVT